MRSIRCSEVSGHENIGWRWNSILVFAVVLILAGIPPWVYRSIGGRISLNSPYWVPLCCLALAPFVGTLMFLFAMTMPTRYVYAQGPFTQHPQENGTVEVVIDNADGGTTSVILTDVRWIKALSGVDVLYITRRYNVRGVLFDTWVDLRLDDYSHREAQKQWARLRAGKKI